MTMSNLKGQNMEDIIGLDDLIANLNECLSGSDAESIADAYNRICSTNIQPLGDDRYRHSDGGEIDGDDALKHIADCLAENMDGEDIADHYNRNCSDQVVYEGDSLFRKIESKPVNFMNYTDLVKSLATDDVGRLDVLLAFLEQNTNVVITPEMLQEFIDSKKILPAKFIMEFETDWDFSIKFKDRVYSDMEFEIRLSSVEELDEMEVMGPHGSPSTSNIWVFESAVKQIKANPNEHFSNMGGNRGVSWTPISNESDLNV